MVIPNGPVAVRKAQPERIDEWRIEFALQAVDDPSLLVSAATVWSDGPELTALERHVAHPDEHLLRGLGRAARLVPSLIPALSDMTPCDLATDATGILAFLRDGAQVLEEAGFGVQAPPWWHSSKITPGPSTQGSDRLQDRWLGEHHRARRYL